MPNSIWPPGLPQRPLWEGWQEEIRSQTVEAPMDVGPAKIRRRTSVQMRDIVACYVFTDAQKSTLISFYLDTLLGGALRFDWPHPHLGVVQARIKAKEPLAIGDKIAPNAWRISIPLEVQL